MQKILLKEERYIIVLTGYFSYSWCIPPTFLSPGPPGGSDPIPPRFFLNNVRSVTGIDAKLDIPLRTSN